LGAKFQTAPVSLKAALMAFLKSSMQELLGLQKQAAGADVDNGAGDALGGVAGEWATVGKKQRNFIQRGDEELSVRAPPRPARPAAIRVGARQRP